MAVEPEDSQSEAEELEGGPVKTFLEHLEDLRWTLIKVTSTLAVSMIVCLVAGNQLVNFLTYPLRSVSDWSAPKPTDSVAVHWGTNVIARFARTNLAALLPETATNVRDRKSVV